MMSELNFFFSNKVAEIFLQKQMPQKLAVAVSGGSDSMALMFLLRDFCQQKNIELFALTVDHQMRENSGLEAQEVAKICQNNQIYHQILTLKFDNLLQRNIEANLRQMRYEVMHEFCSRNQISDLFLGHQLEDVAENFLIRLFRGSGLDGLSAISEISKYKNINLVRPLLEVHKAELQKFLELQKVLWFEDESNSDERFLRNKIRNFLNSFEESAAIQKRIKNAADEIALMRDFIDLELLQQAKDILQFEKGGSFIIEIDKFIKLHSKIALKILAFVLIEVGGKVYKPRFAQLQNFYQYLLLPKIKPRNFYGCIAQEIKPRFVKISREEEMQNFANIVKYDDDFFLIDGRFLTKNPAEKYSPETHKFYFRTILKEIFSDN